MSVGKVLFLTAAVVFLILFAGLTHAGDDLKKGPDPARTGGNGPDDAARGFEVPETSTVAKKPYLIDIKGGEKKEEEEIKKEFEIHGGIVGFYQGYTAGSIEGIKVPSENENGFGIAADLQMTYRPPVSFLEGGRLFVRVHAGKGKGADNDGNAGTALFANLNTIADNSGAVQTDFDSAFWLAEAYYTREFAGGKFAVTVGKTEPLIFIDNNAFANNPNSQFIGKPFVNNPVLDSENQRAPILATTITPIENFSITALGSSSGHPNAVFSKDPKSIYSDILDQPVVAVQLAYSPKFGELQGNYRIYYWNVPYHHENSAGATSADGSGVGLSFDQMVTEKLGLFARVAYSNEEAYDMDWFWSVGANLKGIIPGRSKDELGIGIADLKGTVAPDNLGSEFHFETYYRIYLTEKFAVTPDIQYVANPLGNSHNDGVFAGMLRVEFSF